MEFLLVSIWFSETKMRFPLMWILYFNLRHIQLFLHKLNLFVPRFYCLQLEFIFLSIEIPLAVLKMRFSLTRNQYFNYHSYPIFSMECEFLQAQILFSLTEMLVETLFSVLKMRIQLTRIQYFNWIIKTRFTTTIFTTNYL